MEKDKDILNHLNKAKKADVPEGFFQHFSDDLMAKINESESSLGAFKKSSKPDVPEEFFSNFAKDISENHTPDRPAVKVLPLKVFGFISAVAACLLIMFITMPDEPQAEVSETQEATTTTAELTDEDLMAFVDTDDIIQYILDENIDVITEENQEESLNEESEQPSPELEDLEEEDILYYFEDDLDILDLEDFEL